MTMLARFEALQGASDRRSSDRRLLKLPVQGALADVSGVDAFIHDLSRSGLLIETWTDLQVGNQIEVDLPEAGKTVAQVVWNTGRFFGCQFISAIPAAALSAAMLKNPFPAPPALRDASPEIAMRAVERSDVLPLSTRVRTILGLAVALWAGILLLLALT